MGLTLEISVVVCYDKAAKNPRSASKRIMKQLDKAIKNGLLDLSKHKPLEGGKPLEITYTYINVDRLGNE